MCDHINLGPVILAELGSSVTSHMVWSTATLIEMQVLEEFLSEGCSITQMSNCVPSHSRAHSLYWACSGNRTPPETYI